MDIKVGDIVCWFESGQTAMKRGQVLTINGDMAQVFCDKDMKTYNVKVTSLRKV